jgi:hypothetical protein
MDPLSGSGLAWQWCADGRSEEFTASDGSFIHRQAVLDFDYEMGYLLEVRAKDEPGEHMKIDWLFVYIKHGGCKEITTEWAQAPIHFDWMNADHDAIRRHNIEVIHRWVDWVYAVR